jgi:hypothetical protein
MAAPRGAFSRPYLQTPPSRGQGDGNVLAVGWRVLVVSPAGRGRRVTLTDSDGTTAVGTLADGAEVEILAWRPRRSGTTLYRIRPTGGDTEGWLSGANMKPRPALPVHKVQSIAVARRQPPPKDVASKTVKPAPKAKTVR